LLAPVQAPPSPPYVPSTSDATRAHSTSPTAAQPHAHPSQSQQNPSSSQQIQDASAPKAKQRRYRATPAQLSELTALFDQSPSPPPADLQALAAAIHMPVQSVVLWFKNRRARVPHKIPGGPSASAAASASASASAAASALAAMPSARPLPILPSAAYLPPSSYSTPYGVHQAFRPLPHAHNTASSISAATTQQHQQSASGPSSSAVQTAHDVAATLLGFSEGRADRKNLPAHRNPSHSHVGEDGTDSTRRADRALPIGPALHGAVPPSVPTSSRDSRRRPALTARVCSMAAGQPSTQWPPMSSPALAVPAVVEVHNRAPMTPRIVGQRVYAAGDKVEVLENPEAPSRAWLPATVVNVAGGRGDSDAEPLSLGANASHVDGHASAAIASASTPVTPAEGLMHGSASVWGQQRQQRSTIMAGRSGDETASSDDDRSPQQCALQVQKLSSKRFTSPRPADMTVLPAMSPSRINSQMRYTVEFTQHQQHHDPSGTVLTTTTTTRKVVLASMLRPEPPAPCSQDTHGDDDDDEWRPYVGQAVEYNVGSSWRVAEVRTRIYSKGYQIRQEDGTVCWTPLERLRPFRKWKGDDQWAVTTKLPVTLLKQAAEFASEDPTVTLSDNSDTHSPRSLSPAHSAGRPVAAENSGATAAIRKRRRADDELCAAPRAVSMKLSRATSSVPEGPDGLPYGWKCEKVERAAGILASRVDHFYVAPDGRRHRSLREALRAANQKTT
jgi:Homeodomain/Methyl-CpG binding domain